MYVIALALCLVCAEPTQDEINAAIARLSEKVGADLKEAQANLKKLPANAYRARKLARDRIAELEAQKKAGPPTPMRRGFVDAQVGDVFMIDPKGLRISVAKVRGPKEATFEMRNDNGFKLVLMRNIDTSNIVDGQAYPILPPLYYSGTEKVDGETIWTAWAIGKVVDK